MKKETLTNATTARDWFLKQTGQGKDAVAKHFVAVSTNSELVASNYSVTPLFF